MEIWDQIHLTTDVIAYFLISWIIGYFMARQDWEIWWNVARRNQHAQKRSLLALVLFPWTFYQGYIGGLWYRTFTLVALAVERRIERGSRSKARQRYLLHATILAPLRIPYTILLVPLVAVLMLGEACFEGIRRTRTSKKR